MNYQQLGAHKKYQELGANKKYQEPGTHKKYQEPESCNQLSFQSAFLNDTSLRNYAYDNSDLSSRLLI